MSQILPGWQDMSQKFLLKLFKQVGHLPRTASGSLNSRTKSNSCDLQGQIVRKHSQNWSKFTLRWTLSYCSQLLCLYLIVCSILCFVCTFIAPSVFTNPAAWVIFTLPHWPSWIYCIIDQSNRSISNRWNMKCNWQMTALYIGGRWKKVGVRAVRSSHLT